MVLVRHEIVGRIEMDPARLLAAPDGDPGVAGIGTAQRDLVRGVDGADVARDIGGGETVGAKRRDLDMGEVLADARLAGEDGGERRADVGGARVILEIGLDARGELAGGFEDRPARREGRRTVVAQGGDRRHQRRVVHELAGLDGHGKAIAVQGGTDLFPGRRRGHGRRRGKAHIDFGAHLDVEPCVRLVDAVDVDEIAEVVDVLGGERRCRIGLDADRTHGLAGEVAGAQMGDVVRGIDGAGVGVGGAVR